MSERARSQGTGVSTANRERIAFDLVPSAQIEGDDDTDTALLPAMALDAEAYISSFEWCDVVCDSFFGGGVEG